MLSLSLLQMTGSHMLSTLKACCAISPAESEGNNNGGCKSCYKMISEPKTFEVAEKGNIFYFFCIWVYRIINRPRTTFKIEQEHLFIYCHFRISLLTPFQIIYKVNRCLGTKTTNQQIRATNKPARPVWAPGSLFWGKNDNGPVPGRICEETADFTFCRKAFFGQKSFFLKKQSAKRMIFIWEKGTFLFAQLFPVVALEHG